MTNQHPITPPPELVQEWLTEGRHQDYCSTREYAIAQAANWGWDQRDATVLTELQQARDEELEACCSWLACSYPPATPEALRAARRPKPLSLKEQALKELESLRGDANAHGLGFDAPAIRTALESLPE